ncbi:contractile injection system tape measure protein [uncultured Aquimarina sp.]|uniref:contractile injection system tape measure protein n=1 Tax=uncultured Aquimarina sp. TaxID=575652 RepID=UPI0026362DD7|nr:contractile injection system tape measure protein [uncultured Aquimarina sp.]
MAQQKHIVNKQILEIHVPKHSDTSKIQHELSLLCRNQLTTVLDRVLSKANVSESSLQIDRLTLDLGNVSLQNFETAFTEKLQEELIAYQRANVVLEKQNSDNTHEETPLRAIIYYLKTGVLPWWSKQGNKNDFQEQLALLLEQPSSTFIRLLKELPWNLTYLQRFVYASTEDQLLASFKLLTNLSSPQILRIQNIILDNIQKKYTLERKKIINSFWKTAFLKYAVATTDFAFLKERTKEVLLDLGIDEKEELIVDNGRYAYQIKRLVDSCSALYAQNAIGKEFFKQVSSLVNHPFFDRLSTKILKETKSLLTDVSNTSKGTIEELDANNLLKPLALHLQGLQKELKHLGSKPKSIVTEQLSSPFDDTDFISIQNAGLVLFWPFLERFFENIGVMKDKNFIDEVARNKAICVLQYLCETKEEELFEGDLVLNKIVCGLDIDTVVSPIELSAEEKEIAQGLVTAVIAKGPKWKNLSSDGFRASYLCRQGSLRTRDGHWLLQVKRETHDITLEKIPWGFHTIKLPWMQEILVVEWL